MNFRLDNIRSLQIFQVLRFGSIILVGIIFSKSGMDTDLIGVYEKLLLLASVFIYFWVSGFMNGMLAIHPKEKPREQGILIWNAFLIFCSLALFISGMLYFFRGAIIEFIAPENANYYQQLYPLVCIYLAINTPSFLVEYLLLLQNKAKEILAFGLFAFGLHVLVVCLPILLGYSLQESFYGLIVLAIFKFFILLYLLSKQAIMGFSPALFKRYFWLSLPLVGSVLLAGSGEYVDGTIINAYFQDDDFAIYRYGAKELPLAFALANAFSAAMVPVVAQDWKAALGQIKQRSRKLMHLIFLTSIVLVLVSPFLYPLVFNPEFKASAYIFNIYLLLIISRLVFPQTILTGMQQTHIIFFSSVLEISVNIILSLVFLPYWGLKGIAFASVIAFAIDKLFLLTYARYKYQIRPAQYIDLKLYGSYTLLFLACFVFQWFYL